MGAIQRDTDGVSDSKRSALGSGQDMAAPPERGENLADCEAVEKLLTALGRSLYSATYWSGLDSPKAAYYIQESQQITRALARLLGSIKHG